MVGTETNRRRLVAGLGNPGPEYRRSRHNAGFLVIDGIARETGIPLHLKGGQAWVGKGDIGGVETLLVKPMLYMNNSGPPVFAIAGRSGIAVTDIMVVHDDIDLAFGRIKIKQKGGDGGHRGIRSMVDAFGGGDFARLRMGIGRPGPVTNIVDFVLGEFMQAESESLEVVLERSRNAVYAFVTQEIQDCMNKFNKRE